MDEGLTIHAFCIGSQANFGPIVEALYEWGGPDRSKRPSSPNYSARLDLSSPTGLLVCRCHWTDTLLARLTDNRNPACDRMRFHYRDVSNAARS
jgi:hypothetical protein